MPWKRIVLCVVVLFVPFLIPWFIAVPMAIVAALYVPPIAIVVGLIYDFLYYTGGVPYFTIAGFVTAGIAYFVHRFIKTRIM